MNALRFLGMFLGVVVLSGCAGQQVFKEGQALVDQGRIEEGIAKIEEAVKLEPSNQAYRQAALRAREIAIAQWLAQADDARARARADEARALYQRVQALDPGSTRARAGLEQLARDERARTLMVEAQNFLKRGDLHNAYAKARDALSLSPGSIEGRTLVRSIEEQSVRSAAPALRAAFRRPVSMEFRAAPIKMVFDLLTRSTGLNFLFDREVKQDLPVTIAVTETSVEEVLRFILLTSQLDHRVLNDRTVLVYPATPAKNREYQELVVKTFFLGSADPKAALNLIRTVVKSKDVFIDEKLNMLVMRDTLDAVRMAEKLIANQDRAEPEVMLELEVLEVARTDLLELGARWPDQVSFSLVGASGTAGQLTLTEWQNRSSELVRLGFTSPTLVLNFRNQLARSNLLANPRIRVKNREKARVHIGDKVPVISTTSTATGFVSEAVSYVDVGLKLDVEPLIHIEEEVGIRVALEVSNIVEQTRSQSGTLAYRIGTRNASTVLRLKDGETQILAGLISDEERSSANRVPGLGQLPVIGRLFGSQLDQSGRTEIMLLITPRVVRALARPHPRDMEFASGTEAAAGARISFAPSAAATPASVISTPASSTSSAPTVQPTLPALASTAASLIAPAPIAASALGYLSAPERVKSGETFSVSIAVSMQSGLRGATGRIFYDPLHFRVMSVVTGPLLKAAGAAAKLESEGGAASGALAFTVTSTADIPGTGTLATLTLRALGDEGRSVLRLEGLRLTDAAGRLVPVGSTTPPLITVAR